MSRGARDDSSICFQDAIYYVALSVIFVDCRTFYDVVPCCYFSGAFAHVNVLLLYEAFMCVVFVNIRSLFHLCFLYLRLSLFFTALVSICG